MDLSQLCKNFPILMRIILSVLLFTGIWFIIVLVLVIIEHWDDFTCGIIDTFNFIVKGTR